MSLFTKIFGTHSARELKQITPIVDRIEALDEEYRALSDEELRDKTEEFKDRLEDGETLDDILPEAFAAVREAADRVLGMRPYRVQLIGGIVLHQGRIAEMKTGEGKTLVATLPAYLNALTGRGVHIVTVNDYLARRDSEWMGKVHRFLGLSVGLIVHGLSPEERRAAYEADITYGTNNELGFDYLRDNMVLQKNNMVQRGHVFAIVDEVDSILIDEARTPLIISGQGDASTDLYQRADEFVRRLKKIVYAKTDSKEEEAEDVDADYIVDEKAHSATLTARGISKAEDFFGIPNLADLEHATLSHHINQALKAHGLMHVDVDYVVKDGEVIIVDEFTGRLMFGRRYSDGLHQAIEAKEHVKVARENKTLATITFQNFFRLYEKLSGMTGTALTEEEEFGAIYSLDIIEIPTNLPVARTDHPDVVYKNDNGKNRAILAQIAECHEKGQPVLVGTVSIEKSEYLSSLLKKSKIPHNVLNAKHHEKEAEIVAQAGKFGAVTISTNMAGRGTDIMLGGNAEFMAKDDLRKAGFSEEIIYEATGYINPEDEKLAEQTDYTDLDVENVLHARAMFLNRFAAHKADTSAEAEKVMAAGGLFILGTERHESRRIDNQLRGRAGRQGDPGETRFFLSMTDDVMRRFGSDRVLGMMDTLGIDEDIPIDQKLLSNAIESAQKRVESLNFQSRKSVLEYDDVMNKQRGIIYEQRRKVLDGEDLKAHIQSMLSDVLSQTIHSDFVERQPVTEPEQIREILIPFTKTFLDPADIPVITADKRAYSADGLIDILYDKATARYEEKERELGLIPGTEIPVMRELERVILLRVVDEYWMDHIDAMQDLRQGVSLRAYGQVNPVDEYKRLGFDMFDAMINGIKDEVVRRVFIAKVQTAQSLERKSVANIAAAKNAGGDDGKREPVRKAKKPGRNDPCPCGSGKKYKKCCGMYEN